MNLSLFQIAPKYQCVEIGPHRLYLGNCYDLLPTFEQFDSLVMDPPYIVQTAGGGKYRKARPMMDDIADADLDHGFDLSVLSWKYAGAIICFCSNEQRFEVEQRLRQGFHRVVLLTWNKTNAQPVANKHYRPDTEHYLHAWQKGFHPEGELADKSRYLVSPIVRSPYDHPTVKPDAVMNKVLINVSGKTVCDPFMGTGSTGVAAIRAGRIFTGIEEKPKYFDIAVERIRQTFAEAA